MQLNFHPDLKLKGDGPPWRSLCSYPHLVSVPVGILTCAPGFLGFLCSTDHLFTTLNFLPWPFYLFRKRVHLILHWGPRILIAESPVPLFSCPGPAPPRHSSASVGSQGGTSLVASGPSPYIFLMLELVEAGDPSRYESCTVIIRFKVQRHPVKEPLQGVSAAVWIGQGETGNLVCTMRAGPVFQTLWLQKRLCYMYKTPRGQQRNPALVAAERSHCKLQAGTHVQQCLVALLSCSPPGSYVHGTLQARILERVTMPFSRGSSWPRDWTHVSLALAGGFFTTEPLVQQRPAKTQSSPEWTRKGTMFSYNGWWACQGRKLNSCSPLCHPCAFMSHPFKMENNKDFLDLTSDISIYKVSVPELNLESFVSVRRKKKTTQ